jgi:hypothetical protein
MDLTGSRGKCIKQCVLIAKKSVKFLSSLMELARSIAKNAIQKEKIAAVK